MHGLITDLEQDYKKANVVPMRSGDVVKVTQRIGEASRERLQVFEGLVIRVDRTNSLSCRITVRKFASGVWVEKSFLVHSPNVVKLEVVKRSKVRRNYLSYMRSRVGKAARLKGVDFDDDEVNRFAQTQAPAEVVEEATQAEADDETEKPEEATQAEADDETEKPEEATQAEADDETEKPEEATQAEADDETEKPDQETEEAT